MTGHRPFVPYHLDHVLGAEIEVDFGRRQAVVTQEPLKCRQADPLLHGRHADRSNHIRHHTRG